MGNDRFWYRNDLAEGKREFIVVDAVRGDRKLAFDHDRLAQALGAIGIDRVTADHLPIEALAFGPDQKTVSFRASGKRWECNLTTYEIQETAADTSEEDADEVDGVLLRELPRGSTRNGPESELTFINQSKTSVELFWLDGSGSRTSYGKLEPGRRQESTYIRRTCLAGRQCIRRDNRGL